MDNVQQVQDVYAILQEGRHARLMAHFDPGIEWPSRRAICSAGRRRVPRRAGAGREVLRPDRARLGRVRGVSGAFHDAGDTIVVEGRYTGIHKGTHRRLDAQFCHLWTLRAAKSLVSSSTWTRRSSAGRRG